MYSLCEITRSHGSVTSVVRATREVNGRRQIYPSHHTHTTLVTLPCDRVISHRLYIYFEISDICDS